MKNIIPRVAAVHDMSGYGKCSLTVVLPILSAMGVEACPLPTAMLSTHTGGFEGYTFLDMTKDMGAVINHWKKEDVKFDAIYSGFLGNESQVEIIIDFIEKFKNNNLLAVVDPVLGDNGRLYSTMTDGIVQKMKLLVKHADVITPNLTEAGLLLDKEIKDTELKDEDMLVLCKELSKLGPLQIAVTSVMGVDGKMYVAVYDANEEKFSKIDCNYVDGKFHGTGDIFASVLTGCLVKGEKLDAAARAAVDFITRAIRETVKYPQIKTRDGILFEKVLVQAFACHFAAEEQD